MCYVSPGIWCNAGGGGVSTRLGLHFYILNIEKEKYEVQMLQ